MEILFRDFKEEPNKFYILRFHDGSILKVKMDTYYETDNGLDLDEEGYEEYNACAMEITEVIKDTTVEKKYEKIYKEQMLLEINYHDYPESIVDSNSKVIL